MNGELQVRIGQCSQAGRKPRNQDFHGAWVPHGAALASKGIAIALADGISSSDFSHMASESAVKGFLEDYYCTSDAWSVKTSAQRVLAATNSWLYAQTQQSQGRFDKERGYVCTFSALVLKSRTAHLFHAGDCRIYRVQGACLEQLTTDHRVWVGSGQSLLSRALGMQAQLEIDCHTHALTPGDTFVLATDGVYEHVEPTWLVQCLARHANDLDAAARTIVDHAMQRGSPDNLTVQIVRVEALPIPTASELRYVQGVQLPCPPALQANATLDGFTVVRTLHHSSRSHVYLARDDATGQLVALKTPSVDLREDPDYRERLLMEDWVARRLHSAHVLRAFVAERPRHYLYVATEYVEGQTLAQWMVDHPHPELETVRTLVEQIARGLQAFHRLEMLHQDLRPENILIDRNGTARIIDFGSTWIASVAEAAPHGAQAGILGTVQYTAPEYFLGEGGSTRSDLFSLGTIAYQMLTARLPYGAQVARTRTRSAQRRLRYTSAQADDRAIPSWVDAALRKAVSIDPAHRYGELSEFLHDLRHPNPALLRQGGAPLLERNPLLFWQALCAALLVLVLVLVATHPKLGREAVRADAVHARTSATVSP